MSLLFGHSFSSKEQESFNFMAAVNICSGLEPKKIKSLTVSIVSHLFAIKWWDQMPWSSFSECWLLSQLFHSLLSFSSRGSLALSSLSAIRMVSSAYMMLLIFLPAILIPVCASSSLASRMMYSAYKLSKQGDSIQPWRTHFPIWSQSVVPALTVASWPAYRFLRRQVRWFGIPISLRIFHNLLWCTQSKALASSIKLK